MGFFSLSNCRWYSTETKAFRCPSGYFKSKISTLCHQKCPSGYTSVSAMCTRDPDTKGFTCPDGYFQNKATPGMCYKKCPSGYTSAVATCHRPIAVKGLESMTCKEGERRALGGARCYPKDGDCFGNDEEDAGLCYPRCRDHYYRIGPIC